MRKIGITVEVTKRYYEEIEITDEEYQAFVAGKLDESDINEIDFADLYSKAKAFDDCDYETDYSIVDEDGVTIVDWF